MKYISIDCETTGIDSELDQILSIGLVIEDSNDPKPIDELPSLHLVITRDRLQGNVFALNMNRDIVKLLKEYQVSSDKEALAKEHNVVFVGEDYVYAYIWDFLYRNRITNEISDYAIAEKIYMPSDEAKKVVLNIAGKNFGTFDKLFLEKLPRITKVFRFHQRVLDPAILFVDWKNDDTLPNLDTCMQRGGIEGEVTHDAVQDAKDVIKVLRTSYKKPIYMVGTDPYED